MFRHAAVIVDICLDIIQSIVANKNEVVISFNGLYLYIAQDNDGCSIFIGEVQLTYAIIRWTVSVNSDHINVVLTISLCWLNVMQEMLTC